MKRLRDKNYLESLHSKVPYNVMLIYNLEARELLKHLNIRPKSWH